MKKINKETLFRTERERACSFPRAITGINSAVLSLGNQTGQVILILLLVMLVVLSVVVAVTQRSTTDLSTSTSTEQSTKAYSAAEAGLEQALQRSNTTPNASPIISQNFTLNGNLATATIQNSGLLPIPGSDIGIEYPPMGKESTAQFWLTDSSNPSNNYQLNSYTIYFGNPTSVKAYDDAAGAGAQNISPAIEVTTVKQNTNAGVISYDSQKNYFDSLPSRASGNNFTSSPTVNCSGSPSYNTVLRSNSPFYCRVDVNILNCVPGSCVPQLVRVRLLYANANHKIAIAPSSGGSLPPQVELYTSTGKSGQSQRTLQVFRMKEMLPPWLDFAIFSFNDIVK